ncbi:cutA divalent cation tolerance homolog (E. coli), isoform CRA_a, partial [Mus musculus]
IRPPPCSRPLCSCRFFGCQRYCRWLPAFCCYPELCCQWLLEALRPSPLRPRAPATFQDQSLQPLSLVPTKKSPRRSPVVEKRLAACVNLIPQITSIYEWKGKIEEDSEVLMMIKTQSSLVPALTEFVRSVHPYEVAEVIALPVEQGNPPYLHWVHQVTESVSNSGTALP